MIIDKTISYFIHLWKTLPEAILYLIVGYLVIKILNWIFQKFLSLARVHKEFRDIIQSFSVLMMWVLLISYIAQTLGFSRLAVAISSSLALIGLGVATGANALIADIISGIYLARDRDFKIGRYIKFGEIEGEIEKIDMRKIRVKMKNQKLAIIANSNLDKGAWVVYDKENS